MWIISFMWMFSSCQVKECGGGDPHVLTGLLFQIDVPLAIIVSYIVNCYCFYICMVVRQSGVYLFSFYLNYFFPTTFH